MDIAKTLKRLFDALDVDESGPSPTPRTREEWARLLLAAVSIVGIFLVLLWVYLKFIEIGSLQF